MGVQERLVLRFLTTAAILVGLCRCSSAPSGGTGTGTAFDPGTAAFGIWAYTGQTAGGTATNGDYLYTEDAVNAMGSPQHRVRVWPLADRAGQAVAGSVLLGCEEATNGDYQDYVFVLSNVSQVP